MLTKFFGTLIGTMGVILALIIVAIIGVAAVFIGYFLLWGFIGLCMIGFIWFLIWAAIDEWKQRPRRKHDPDDPGP
ncbi:hypothetical protein HYO98_gp56 [Dinoroseobacter phage DS-1410Ws-06]|uniref:Uncharacterized protein n=1 Tax=Dinoroseobacter phage DS-1410Ws-06 TaxID=1815983 RepID=A0A191VYC9_9CAUD|nr:hypothetical protein HYO98_gp56 [Dinoroseobacter phage DS-1410Ws-06]ANJ20713.1 hypothetical protein DSp06_gp56 [Dinoroseobacter phage DS-1410Ws-06]